MVNIKHIRGIYAIINCDCPAEEKLLEKTEKILDAGVTLLQYRNKSQQKRRKRVLAARIQNLCQQYETFFIVNDDPALAADINADGVHLGRDDADITVAREVLGNKLIGISCYNSLERAVAAQLDGADYIAFGAFFPSVTKPDAPRADTDLLRCARTVLTIPIVAVGGVTPENGGALIASGADCLAVANGLYAATDIAKTARAYQSLFEQ